MVGDISFVCHYFIYLCNCLYERSIIMIRIIELAFLCLTVVCQGHAQNRNPIRDSLAMAMERLAYHPDSIDLCLKKAGWNIQLQQWQYAQETYDKVLNRDPNNIAALYYRAYVNEKQGRYNFARMDYLNLLKIVPGNFEGQLGLALLNQRDHHYTEAMDQMNRLVDQFPDSAVAYAARGGVEREQKMFELAEYDYSEAVRRDASNIDYILNHVDLLILLNRKQEARLEVERLVVLGVPRNSLMEYYRKMRK